jgi:hypothetical protein
MQYSLGNEVSFLRATAGQAPHAVIALRVEEQARRSTSRNAVTPSPFAHADVCSIKPLNEYRAPTKMDLALLEGKTHNIRIRLLCGQCHHLKKARPCKEVGFFSRQSRWNRGQMARKIGWHGVI